MFGFLGTVLVVAQMIMLAIGQPAELALTFGLFAAVCWMLYAIQQRDQWILYTNTFIFGIATYGLFF